MKLPRVPPMNSFGLLVLRASGLMLAVLHGWPKLSQWTESVDKWPDPFHVGHAASLGLTVFAEFACAILVALGLYTRAACVPIVVMFGVIVFKLQAAQPWSEKDLAIIYALPFLALMFCGPGRYSLDGLRGSPSAKK